MNLDLQVGDRCVVTRQNYSPQNYPWIPDLIGRTGKIKSRQVTGQNDVAGGVYVVELDEPVKVGVVPEGEHSFGYVPEKYEDSTTFALTFLEVDALPTSETKYEQIAKTLEDVESYSPTVPKPWQWYHETIRSLLDELEEK